MRPRPRNCSFRVGPYDDSIPCPNEGKHDVAGGIPHREYSDVCDDHACELARDGWDITSDTMPACDSCGEVGVHTEHCTAMASAVDNFLSTSDRVLADYGDDS